MKIKISKSQWQLIGKKAGWIKEAQVIPDDGYADGGEPYTDEEMDLMEKGPFFVSTYEVERAFGGPEEGGWWYDAFTYMHSEDKTFDTRGEAERVASVLNRQYHKTNDDLGSTRGFESPPEDTEDSQIPRGFSGSARAMDAVVEKVKGENDTMKKGRPHYE